MFVEVAVNRPIHHTYHYHIPADFAEPLQAGHLVEIEFGTARVNGIVLGLHEHSPVPETKPVLRLLDKTPVLNRLQLHLAQWLAEHTLAAIGPCLWLMLPPGLTTESSTRYQLVGEGEANTTKQKAIIGLLKRRGALSNHQIERVLKNWRPSIQQLVKRGIVQAEDVFSPPKAQPKLVRAARLAIPPESIPLIIPTLGQESKQAAVIEVLYNSAHQTLLREDLLELAEISDSTLRNMRVKGEVTIEQDGMVRLNIPLETVEQHLIELRGAQVYLDILSLLAQANDTLSVSQIYAHSSATLKHLKRLADDGLIVLGEEEVWRDPLSHLDIAADKAPTLTPEQAQVWEQIQAYMIALENLPSSNFAKTAAFLVHGVTGSGKTEIYMRAVAQVLAQGRQAIVLVPEIALTPQVVQRFLARFPQRVAIIHSRLSAGERYDSWRRIRGGEVDIVVGTRSALFAPLADVGLIVLDEEHDDSYKQSPSPGIAAPYYHARELAIAAMRMNGGTVILGSATPDIGSMYRATQGEFALLSLPKRVMAQHQRADKDLINETVMIELPAVRVIDMRHELRMGNRSIFSRELQRALAQVLEAKQQAILFMNRRGTATFVMCRDCGHVVKCERCETPLTYHAPREALVCHYCGHHQENPTQCPQCGSKRIKYFGTGTEKIDQSLAELFPHARVLRWDQDTAKERGAHERILRQFVEQEADILVGTQMIAKGLDIPLVTLVGIVSGDTAIGLPDYRAGERSFQILTQVAGRAGRGIWGGQVILQTYHPTHYAIEAAAEHDFHRFYEQEIRYRRETRYPPFSRLARLLFLNHNQATAQQDAEAMCTLLKKRKQARALSATEIIGPTPCFFTRLDNVYRWQVLVRSPDPSSLLHGVELGRALLDIDPIELL